jgi:hypothetical protein
MLLTAALALAVLTAAPASAAPLRRVTALSIPGCRVIPAWTRLRQDTAGLAHGFAGVECGAQRDIIQYLEGSKASWRSARTPWRGRVLATAWDGTGTYLLFTKAEADGTSIHVAKRTGAGAFSTPRKLGQAPFGIQVTGGSMVAARGRWWGVWSEAPVSGGAELYQARTLGTRQNRSRITNTPANDDTAHLLLPSRPGAGPALYWRRDRGIMTASTTLAGPWRSRLLDAGMDMIDTATLAGTTTVLAWSIRPGGLTDPAPYEEIRVTDNSSGTFRTTTVGRSTGDYGPAAGVSMGRVFVSWATGPYNVPARAQLAVRSGGRWTTRALGGPAGESQRIVAVVPRQGRANVLIEVGGRLLNIYE